MKKIYIVLSLLALNTINLKAQSFSIIPSSFSEIKSIPDIQKSSLTNCGNDTLLYTLSKTTVAEVQSFSTSNNYVEVAQRYEVPQEITVHGLCYYAYTDVTGNADGVVELRIWSVDTINNIPNTMITSILDTLPMISSPNLNTTKRCITWPTPVVTSEDFFVSLYSNGTNEPVGVFRNSFAAGDGDGEALSAVYFDDGSGASYVQWYNQTEHPAFTSPGPAWDYDYLLEPIVSYNLELSPNWSQDSICLNDQSCVNSDSTLTPLISHRMYDKNTSGVFTNWGDGVSLNGDSTCHYYLSGGSFNAVHGININGWTTSCFVSDTNIFTVKTVSDLTTTTSGSTITSNNSLSTYQWLDCNNNYDLIPGETTASFTSSVNGSYAVELTENGCVDTSACVSITTVGIIENNLNAELIVYPNPTNGKLSVDLGSTFNTIKVSIRDINAKLIQSSEFNNSQILNLNLNAPSGIYVLTIESNENRAVVRLVNE